MPSVPFTERRSVRGRAFSPGGETLAFTTVRSSIEANANLTEILALDLATNAVKTLTALAGAVDGPVWIGPERLAYAVAAEVYEVNLAGRVRRRASARGAVRQLVLLAGTMTLLGTVSAKAPREGAPFVTRRLPYKQDGRGRIHGPDGLIAVRADGGVVEPKPGCAPCPSPDGRALAHLAQAARLEFGDNDLAMRTLDPHTLALGEAARQEGGGRSSPSLGRQRVALPSCPGWSTPGRQRRRASSWGRREGCTGT